MYTYTYFFKCIVNMNIYIYTYCKYMYLIFELSRWSMATGARMWQFPSLSWRRLVFYHWVTPRYCTLYVCCSVLQHVAACCSVCVLQEATTLSLRYAQVLHFVCALHYVAVCCSLLQCVCTSVPPNYTPAFHYNSVLQCIAVCWSVFHCVAVCCSASVLQFLLS